MMNKVHNHMILIFLCLLMATVRSETQEVRLSLVQFMKQMSPPWNITMDSNWGWNENTDPCISPMWKGVDCVGSSSVKRLVLDDFNLIGVLDAKSLCEATSLSVFSLNGNKVNGNVPEEISNCKKLTHLYLQGNNFSGNLPNSISRLNNLKRLDISNNGFTGELPNVARISGLLTFLAENNDLSGPIPSFDFTNLQDFNISNNNFTGPIPKEIISHFTSSSILGNNGLCGPPLSNPCPLSSSTRSKKKDSSKMYLIYLGFGLLGGLVIVLIIVIILNKIKKKKPNEEETVNLTTSKKDDMTSSKIINSLSTESKVGKSRSEFSLTSPEPKKSISLVILSTPVSNGLKFEDLLRAPAELIGRGNHGTLYKVALNNGLTLVVKRIKDWDISGDNFKKRMHKLDKVKHQNVLPVAAYYCSKQEKLLVYEFQKNGSLFKLLHGSQNGETFKWKSRLNVASRSSNAMAFMHEKFQNDDISHYNLKSSNILLNNEMEPCISEYGLMEEDNQDQLSFTRTESIEEAHNPTKGKKINGFKADIYAFGVILLELLTGKLVHNRRSDLARWVNSVVREEWTAEVFDKGLISEGANEERMVNLLQIALKCINPTPETRPSMSQVASIISTIRGEEESAEEERSTTVTVTMTMTMTETETESTET